MTELLKTLKTLPVERQSLSSDDVFKGYATVEHEDSEGDIIRVAGMSLEPPAGGRIKVFGTPHKYNMTTPDQLPAIMGTVVDVFDATREIEGKTYPAKIFVAEYAKDDEGITAYARKMRGLYRSGTLDSFSVGIVVDDYKKRGNKGYDILKSRLFEISAAPMPANKYATYIKTLKNELGDVDEIALLEERISSLQKSVDELSDMVKTFTGSVVQDIEAAIVAMLNPVVHRSQKKPEADKNAKKDEIVKELQKLSVSLEKLIKG
ncbi:MAG: hypothetical protein KatS3mg104_3058 [Phycisphaerae bacterium]|nr:MAG: hypothetical protein KatS3mg104_3058 [Phycisphaerae bacterium]